MRCVQILTAVIRGRQAVYIMPGRRTVTTMTETHDKRTGTHACDLISRQVALDALDKVAEMFPYRIPGKAKTYRQYNEAWSDAIDAAENALEALPSAQPEITYQTCSDALLKIWMVNVLTDGEYNRIMDKLNAWERQRRC